MIALVNRFRAYLHKLENDIRSDWDELKQEFKKDWNKVPNIFTGIRLICSPIPGLLLWLNSDSIKFLWAATIIFMLVALTDKIDGYLARKLNQVTRLGEALDPAVDKVLIALTLVAIVATNSIDWIKISMSAIVFCEVIVVWLSFRAQHQKTPVAVTYFGKFKMFMQCIAIIILSMPINLSLLVYQATVIIIVAITFASLMIYLFRFHIWRKNVE